MMKRVEEKKKKKKMWGREEMLVQIHHGASRLTVFFLPHV